MQSKPGYSDGRKSGGPSPPPAGVQELGGPVGRTRVKTDKKPCSSSEFKDLKDSGVQLSEVPSEDIFEMESIPSDPKKRTHFERLIKAKFVDYLENRAPEAYRDTAQWKLDFDKLTDDSKKQIRDLFDEFILEQARTIGFRLMVHPAVLSRMLEWQDTGDERFDQLLKNLDLCVRVGRGEARLLISEHEWYAFKKDLVPELKILKNRLKNQQLALGRGRSAKGILSLVKEELSQPIYQRLRTNRTAFLSYLQHEEHKEEAEAFVSGRLSSAQLADCLIAWSRNYSNANSARKAISKIGNRPRRAQKKKKTANFS